MSVGTSIEWTDASWNPLRARRKDDGKTGWHCEKVSAGCANCYAETFNGRGLPNGGTKLRYARDQREKVETYLDENVLTQPLRWRKPRKVFVCSMTDLFGEWVTDEQIDLVFAVMALAKQHTFQVLTKRPQRMRAYFASLKEPAAIARGFNCCDATSALLNRMLTDVEIRLVERLPHGFPNVWLGVSVENQETADERVPLLLETPAAVRFLSCEPLLGPIDLLRVDARGFGGNAGHKVDCIRKGYWDPRTGFVNHSDMHDRFGPLHWVIVGGESGPGARPCDVAWVRSIVTQCSESQTACFVKQLGANVECANDQVSDWLDECGIALDDIDTDKSRHQGDPMRVRLRDRKGGDPSEWPADLRVREFPAGAGARA